jgi:Ca-activated chloride channel family protein
MMAAVHGAVLLLCACLQAAPGRLEVRIVEPAAGDFVRDRIEIVAAVAGDEPVARVEFEVDGVPAAVVSTPPFSVLVDVGEENLEHHLRVVAHGVHGSQAADSLTTRRIQINDELQVTLQQLYITVTSGGEPVHGLTRDDFRVIDQGEPQEIVTFARGDIPFVAVLLVDASSSMEGAKLASALRGVGEFASRMKVLDQAKLVVFSDQIRLTSPFTSFSDLLTAGLESVSATGGTAINDALYLSLARLEERQGRRVVVLLSDGLDSHSALRMRHVVPEARRTSALVYLIRTQEDRLSSAAAALPNAISVWRDVEGHRQEYRQLVQVVTESGGKVFGVDSPAAIEAAFAAIVAELRDHYVLGYYPSSRRADGAWHEVEVEVDRPGVEVRTTAGYLDL